MSEGVHIGAVGAAALKKLLKEGGQSAIIPFQNANNLALPRIASTYHAFDSLQISRNELHSTVLSRLKTVMMRAIKSAPRDL